MERRTTLYGELLEEIKRQKKHDGIAVSTIPSVMQRGDGSNIFEEGDEFSGNILIGQAEASLTVASSPHYRPTIPYNTFIEEARNALLESTKLSKAIDQESTIAPHLLLWWRDTNGDSQKFDLFDISRSSLEVRQNFTQSIAIQAKRGMQFLDKFSGTPIIYGTWGFGTPDERSIAGLSRGGPTMGLGHAHIAKIYEEDQEIEMRDNLSTEQRLKHYAPWNHLFNKYFSHDLAAALETILFQESSRRVDVSFQNRAVKHTDRPTTSQECYEVTYQTPLPFKDAFSDIITIAGKTETFYQEILALFSAFHLSSSDQIGQENAVEAIREACLRLGLDEGAAISFSQFILRIKPTHGQVLKWKNQIEQQPPTTDSLSTVNLFNQGLKKRDRFMQEVKLHSTSHSLNLSLIADTYKEPSDSTIAQTFPVHSSAAYLFDDIFLKDDELWVSKITLIPALVSTAGAPERILGVEILRDTGNLKI